VHPYLFLLLLAIGAFLFFRWFVNEPPAQRKKFLASAGLAIIITLLLFMVATGRLNWIAALIASLAAGGRRLLPLLRYLPLIKGLNAAWQQTRSASGPAAGSSSTVSTDMLRMHLDHDTGAMDGEVIQGAFQGRKLSQLSLAELNQLFAECQRRDAEAAQLLSAYMDRQHGSEWRHGTEQQGTRQEPQNGTMTNDEALQVLGLQPGAGRDDIIAAHRRLMQKLHPDRGGSDYLAAKINQAKELLLQG
jgi:hypothetical protein